MNTSYFTVTEVLITMPKGKSLLERNIRHISHGKCMDDVRAGNSHHQVVIQASRQQSKCAAGLLCIISEFSMCTPIHPWLMSCTHAEKNWISFLPVVPFSLYPFLFMSFNPQRATLPKCLQYTALPYIPFYSLCRCFWQAYILVSFLCTLFFLNLDFWHQCEA